MNKPKLNSNKTEERKKRWILQRNQTSEIIVCRRVYSFMCVMLFSNSEFHIAHGAAFRGNEHNSRKFGNILHSRHKRERASERANSKTYKPAAKITHPFDEFYVNVIFFSVCS